MLNTEKLRAEYEATLPPLILRKHVAEYTGGLYTVPTMRVYDSQGKGPRNRIRRGQEICYQKADFIEWLLNRLEAVND